MNPTYQKAGSNRRVKAAHGLRVLSEAATRKFLSASEQRRVLAAQKCPRQANRGKNGLSSTKVPRQVLGWFQQRESASRQAIGGSRQRKRASRQAFGRSRQHESASQQAVGVSRQRIKNKSYTKQTLAKNISSCVEIFK